MTDSVTSNGLTTFIERLGGKHFRYGLKVSSDPSAHHPLELPHCRLKHITCSALPPAGVRVLQQFGSFYWQAAPKPSCAACGLLKRWSYLELLDHEHHPASDSSRITTWETVPVRMMPWVRRYRRGYKNVISKGVELNKQGTRVELMMETR